MSARAASAPGAGVLDRLQVLRSAPTPLRGAPAATWTPSPRTGVGPLRVPGPGLQPSSHDTTTTRTDPAGSTLATPDFGPKDGVHLNPNGVRSSQIHLKPHAQHSKSSDRVTHLTSGVRQADGALSRASRARVTFARMSDAFFVQMKGFGLSLWYRMYSSIASMTSGTLRKTPRRRRLAVRSRKKRSTMLSQDALVGV